MNLTQTLTEQLAREEEAKLKAAAAAEVRRSVQGRLAAAFDAAQVQIPKLPMMHIHALYGRAASLAFSGTGRFPCTGVTVQVALALLKAFPPLPAGIAKGTFTSWMSKAFFDQQLGRPQGFTSFKPSPVIVSLDWISGRSTAKVEWLADLDDLEVEFSVELERDKGGPALWVDTRHHNGVLVEIRRIDTVLTGDMKGFPMPLVMGYASGGPLYVGKRLMHSAEGKVEALLEEMARLDAATNLPA